MDRASATSDCRIGGRGKSRRSPAGRSRMRWQFPAGDGGDAASSNAQAAEHHGADCDIQVSVTSRSRLVLDHCQHELRGPAEPKTVEERLTAATAAINWRRK
jgi:hypothetical protein